MEKEYKKHTGENRDQLNEPDGMTAYEKKIALSLRQAKEGKTVKVRTDEELKKLLDNL